MLLIQRKLVLNNALIFLRKHTQHCILRIDVQRRRNQEVRNIRKGGYFFFLSILVVLSTLVSGVAHGTPTVTAVTPMGEISLESIPVEITAVVVDDVSVDTVFANITLPGGSQDIVTLTNATNNTYTGTFNNTEMFGDYIFTIVANDTSNNVNASETGNFSVIEILGFPTNDLNDGRFLAIVGKGLSTVDSTNISIFTIFDSNTTNVSIALYDGDNGENFDFSQTGEIFNTTYLVYTDNTLNFSTETLVANRSSLNFSNMDVDLLVNKNHSSEATGPDGNFYYRIDVVLDNPDATQLNTFKVLTPGDGIVFFPATSFQILGSDNDFVSAGCTPFPSCGLGINTTFFESGENFSFLLDVPVGRMNFSLIDDDADFVNDSSNPGAPAIEQVRYDVFFPNGSLIARNSDPSGNFTDAENFTVDIDGMPGLYSIVFERTNTLDGGGINPNNIFFLPPFKLFSSTPFYFLDIIAFKSVLDNVNNITRPGKNVSYLISVANTEDEVLNFTLVDLLPANTSYVPGSITLDGVSLTDANDTDEGDFNITNPDSITVTFANLSEDQLVNISFTVKVNPVPNGTVISNQGNVTFDGESTLTDDPDTLLVDDTTDLTVILEQNPPSVVIVQPLNETIFNQSDVVTIQANVTDDVAVDTVFVNITDPNGTSVLETMTLNVSPTFEFNFTSTSILGNYTFFIIANDTSGNVNDSEFGFFTVVEPVLVVLAFTLTLPGEAPVNATPAGATTAVMEFNSSSNTNLDMEPCVGSTGACQNSTTPFFVYTNTGTVNLSVDISLNSNLPLLVRLTLTLSEGNALIKSPKKNVSRVRLGSKFAIRVRADELTTLELLALKTPFAVKLNVDGRLELRLISTDKFTVPVFVYTKKGVVEF